MDWDLYEQDILEQFCKIMRMEGRKEELNKIENMDDVRGNDEYENELYCAMRIAQNLQGK